VLACLPWNCIMLACNDSQNYYNLGELFRQAVGGSWEQLVAV
jgi:hypothetical protein